MDWRMVSLGVLLIVAGGACAAWPGLPDGLRGAGAGLAIALAGMAPSWFKKGGG